MSTWIYPAVERRGIPIIVEADTHAMAKEKIAKCPDYDGGKVLAIEVGFYATLCETGAIAPILIHHGEPL